MKRTFVAILFFETLYAATGFLAPVAAVLSLTACSTTTGDRQETRQGARVEGRTKERQQDRGG